MAQTETTARQFVFAALIFAAVATGAITMIASFINPAASTDDYDEYQASFDKFTEIRAQQTEVSDQIEDAEPSSGVLGILNGLIESSWGSLKLIWQSVTSMKTIIDDTSDHFQLPTWFTGLLTGIIIISVAFALMAAWFKWHI